MMDPRSVMLARSFPGDDIDRVSDSVRQRRVKDRLQAIGDGLPHGWELVSIQVRGDGTEHPKVWHRGWNASLQVEVTRSPHEDDGAYVARVGAVLEHAIESFERARGR